MISSLYPAVSALNSFGVGVQNAAHNLANVKTDNFKAGRVNYSELPSNSGVQVQSIQNLDTQGSLIPYGSGSPPMEGQAGYVPEGFVEGSTTDVALEMVNLIADSRSYQANAKTVQTVDDMLGTVINIKV